MEIELLKDIEKWMMENHPMPDYSELLVRIKKEIKNCDCSCSCHAEVCCHACRKDHEEDIMKNKNYGLLEIVRESENRSTHLDKEIEWHEQHSLMVTSDFASGFIQGMNHARKIMDGYFDNMQHNKVCDQSGSTRSSSSSKPEPTPTKSSSPSEGLGQNY